MIKEFTDQLILRNAIHKEDLNKMEFVLLKETKSTDKDDTIKSFHLTNELEALLNKKIGLGISWRGIDYVDVIAYLARYNGLLMLGTPCIDHEFMDLTGEIVTIFIDDCEDDD